MEMSSEQIQDHQWRSCWQVVENPSPGVAFAMAIECSHRQSKNPYLRRKTRGFQFQADEQPQRVLWLGWNPDEGLVVAYSAWHPDKGKPKAPSANWVPQREDTSETRRHHRAELSKDGHISTEFRYSNWGGLPYPPWLTSIRNLEHAQASRLLHDNWTSFLSRLPERVPEALEVLGGVVKPAPTPGWGVCGPNHLNQLDNLLGSRPPEGVDTATASLRRRQFVLSHPVLARTDLILYDDDIKRAIDTAQELTPLLAAKLGTEERIIRAFTRIPPESLNAAREFLHTPVCLSLLEGMDPSWMGALGSLSPGAWEALGNLSCQSTQFSLGAFGNLRRLGGIGGNLQRRNRETIRADSMARHLGSTLSPDASGSLEWLAGTTNLWAHLQDTADAMGRELILPALARNDPHAEVRGQQLAMRDAILAMGVRKAARCLQYHLTGVVHDARLGRALKGEEFDDAWGEAAPPVKAPNGLTLRFLRNQVELSAEGSAMHHCVGSYGESCSRRLCAIISVGRWRGERGDNPRWVPSSTIELRMGESGDLYFRQHYGFGNGTPPAENRKAAEWWLEEAKAGRIELRPGSLRDEYPSRPAARNIEDLLGEAWRTPEAHRHRWDRWKRLLGARRPCFGDWLLSLPAVYLECHTRNADVAALAVDMDEEMKIALEIEVAEAAAEAERDYDPDAITEENAPGGPAL